MSEQEKEPRELADIKSDLRNVHMGLKQRIDGDQLGDAVASLVGRLGDLIDDLDNLKLTYDE